MHPREVDALEVWEVASILGLHRSDGDDDESPDNAKIPSGPKRMSAMTSEEVIRARVLHAQDPDRYPLPIADSGGASGLAGMLGAGAPSVGRRNRDS